MLSETQKAQFWRDGYLVIEEAVTPGQLQDLHRQLAAWVEESRQHQAPFGPPTVDGRPRFDMGGEHSAASPALRRVNNPSDISPAFEAVMLNAATVDMVAELIGPDVKFHHCKVNLKLPGSRTEVGYHQDFPYTPHSNDDIITALLLLDDMSEENGCLMVVPGSHRGPIHSLYDGDRFTGIIDAETMADLEPGAVPVTGEPYGLATIVDRCLDDCDEVYFEGGDHRSLVHVTGKRFDKLMKKMTHGHISA